MFAKSKTSVDNKLWPWLHVDDLFFFAIGINWICCHALHAFGPDDITWQKKWNTEGCSVRSSGPFNAFRTILMLSLVCRSLAAFDWLCAFVILKKGECNGVCMLNAWSIWDI